MKKAFLFVLLVVLLSFSVFCSAPKYVFFFIGDGMGLAQINAAQLYKSSMVNAEQPKLHMLTLPVKGMQTTHSYDSFITDSAPAGTALATGYKTKNGVIGLDPTLKYRLETIAEFLLKKGKKIGIISSVSIDHATPASFYAHQASRNDYYEIAIEMVNSGFHFFAGGGFIYPEGKKGDQLSIYELAKNRDYTLIQTYEGFSKLTPSTDKVIVINSVLDSSKAMPYDIDRQTGEFSLVEITEKAIDFLDNEKGFFLMVEGGKIDWACHANDAAATIHDTLIFDESIKVALDFLQKHPQETLILVTGDHETGGLSIGFAGTKYEANVPLIGLQKISFQDFDNVLATLKEEKRLSSLNDLYPAIEEAFGLVPSKDKASNGKIAMSEYDIERLEKAFQDYVKQYDSKNEKSYLLYGGYNALSVTLTHILNEKAGLGWTTYSHTGVPVPVYAIGNSSDAFAGYYDNTDIGKTLFSLYR
ncbi:MAG: alkaline phosphatase [Thermotogae bacterium]|nr:alkaline phosphatase [Thermotogota bacterium]HPB88153.1 alkaline phosphatase [Thermotogota bacterium]